MFSGESPNVADFLWQYLSLHLSIYIIYIYKIHIIYMNLRSTVYIFLLKRKLSSLYIMFNHCFKMCLFYLPHQTITKPSFQQVVEVCSATPPT